MNAKHSLDEHVVGSGIAVPDERTLDERARQLARIEGRAEPNANDFEQARNDLLTIGSAPVAPEVGELENLTVWDTPLTAAGRAVPERVLEDETMVAEKLVEEGVEEADHEARLRASEEMNDEEPQE